MAFKVLGGVLIIMLACLGLWCLRAGCAYIYRRISVIFQEHDEEEQLSDEEKHKLYLEKKNRELARERIAIQNTKQSSVEYENPVKIVGFMEPIGRWTRLVMSEKHQRLIGVDQSRLRNGFWQMLVSMKGMYQGKHRGRSR
ncbi:hypothetical protein [Anaplasma bovis]|uniref:hypothetical protein n=1 Tax=Anaplasma bovis TaxID=186733 RepID=UPI002FF3D03A